MRALAPGAYRRSSQLKEAAVATRTVERFETVIIGGGQAGLATGYHLQETGQVLRHPRRGRASRRLVAEALAVAAPVLTGALRRAAGHAFPAPAQSFPTAGEMADYLEAYAERFALPVRTGIGVDAVEKDGEGYVVRAGDQRFEADNVVVATGVFQHDRPSSPISRQTSIRNQAAALGGLPKPRAAAARTRPRRRRRPLGRRHRPRSGSRRPPNDAFGPRYRSDSAQGDHVACLSARW